MSAQASTRDHDSPLDLLDEVLDEHDPEVDERPAPDRATWGRTPDALAGQEQSQEILPGGVL